MLKISPSRWVRDCSNRSRSVPALDIDDSICINASYAASAICCAVIAAFARASLLEIALLAESRSP